MNPALYRDFALLCTGKISLASFPSRSSPHFFQSTTRKAGINFDVCILRKFVALAYTSIWQVVSYLCPPRHRTIIIWGHYMNLVTFTLYIHWKRDLRIGSLILECTDTKEVEKDWGNYETAFKFQKRGIGQNDSKGFESKVISLFQSKFEVSMVTIT